MGEMTIDDLVSDDDGGSGGSDSGQWVMDMVDKLDEKGILQPLVFGEQRDIEEIQQERQQGGQQPQQTAADGGTEATDELDAQKLKGLLLQVYDNTGMIPGLDEDPKLSEIIELVDGNPDMVDQLLQQYL